MASPCVFLYAAAWASSQHDNESQEQAFKKNKAEALPLFYELASVHSITSAKAKTCSKTWNIDLFSLDWRSVKVLQHHSVYKECKVGENPAVMCTFKRFNRNDKNNANYK